MYKQESKLEVKNCFLSILILRFLSWTLISFLPLCEFLLIFKRKREAKQELASLFDGHPSLIT